MGLREVLTSGKPAIGAWCVIPGSFTAEAVAAAGFDWVCIDAQHGLIGYQEMLGMLQAVAVTGLTPIRVGAQGALSWAKTSNHLPNRPSPHSA